MAHLQAPGQEQAGQRREMTTDDDVAADKRQQGGDHTGRESRQDGEEGTVTEGKPGTEKSFLNIFEAVEISYSVVKKLTDTLETPLRRSLNC